MCDRSHGLRAGDSNVQTILLAGGLGTRLRPYTAIFPKPLMPLGEMPVMEILLRRLELFGFTDVTICTGHLAELIMAFFGTGGRFGMQIRYVREDKPLGTAGPIKLVQGLSDPFMVMNGDLLTTLDFSNLLAAHSKNGADATIAIYNRKVQIDFGVVEVADDGYLDGYSEKPAFRFDVSMGVYVFSRSVLEIITTDGHMDIPDLMKRIQREGGRVACHRSDCYWLDIGRAEDYTRAQEEFERDSSLFLPNGRRPRTSPRHELASRDRQ